MFRILIAARPLRAHGENMTDRLDINTAEQDALDAIDELKGHGPEIIRYREERGGFSEVEQPPSSRIIAASPFTLFGVLHYEDQEAISFQCHPEWEPEYAEALIGHRRCFLPDPEAALESLQLPNDREQVGGWIRRFLTGSAGSGD